MKQALVCVCMLFSAVYGFRVFEFEQDSKLTDLIELQPSKPILSKKGGCYKPIVSDRPFGVK